MSRPFWLGVALVFLLSSCTTNTPSTFAPGGPAAATTSSLWWWEINSPQHDVSTANETHIPVGQPVTLQLTSDDVIHSFWVPQLHGKLDLIPGRTNTLWLQADEPGAYGGLCAELCGVQHAKMLFMVAKPPTELADWLSQQAQPAIVPSEATAERGFQVFMEANCDECHVIQGTEADGELGPDLTHFADRSLILHPEAKPTDGAQGNGSMDSSLAGRGTK